jgi:leucyl aminopeptidase
MTLVGRGGKKASAAVDAGTAIAEAVALARDLVNTPPGDLSPAVLAKQAIAVAERAGLEVEVVDEKQARKLGMGGLAGVGQGSDNPPRLVKLSYVPAGARASLGLVGKGITFDSGGLSLKPPDGMITMKCDMSGAAAVLAAMSVLPALGGRVAVRGYLCAAENMPSGKAIRPGDVLRMSNGKTVEVLNTDAEGRLVMADGLVTAVAEGADAVVDVATLTGACVVALGDKVAGLMGNHDGFLDQVRAAADRAGEAVWPLPLPEEYRSLIDSDVADIKNVSGGRSGGALTAGLFLREFVDGTPWAHLDIAGPAFLNESSPLHPKGATGFAVRTLVELATTFRKPGRA